MLVTELGISICVISAWLTNAPGPIVATVLGMTVFLQPIMSVLVAVSIRALQLSRESYTVFPASTSIDIKPTHPLYALEAILVTEDGMVIEARLEQSRKALLEIVVTDDGRMIEARLEQP